MKDKNGIEVCCENCRCVCKYDSMCLAHTPPSFFRPMSEALEARIAELQEVIKLDLKSVNIDDINDTLTEVYEDKIKELEENFFVTVELLGEIGQERDRLRKEVENLKKELSFTDEEIEFIKIAISMAIPDCETNPPKPSEEQLKLMWSIKSKCDELLNERKD